MSTKEFEPRPYQKEVADWAGLTKGTPMWISPRRHTYGIDVGSAEGDKTVVAHGITGRNGITQIFFDEYAYWPHYKWYQHPIQWYKWHRTLKQILRSK